MSLESMSIDFSDDNETATADQLTFQNACTKGNLSVVKVYLAQQAFDMNVGDEEGSIGFHLACGNGKLNVVQFLIEQGFDMNVGDDYGNTGFHFACLEGHLNVVQFLIEQGFVMNVVGNAGKIGFHWACFNGHLNVVQFILKQGFDMNVGDCFGGTGFHWACFNGHLNVVQFMLKQGFDMNVGDNEGKTAFFYACIKGDFNVVQFLLRQGFEGINEVDIRGMTALNLLIEHIYDYENHERLPVMPFVVLLIESGAKLNGKYIFKEIFDALNYRVFEITVIKEMIFKKWTGRIAQAITDFTMAPFTNTSLQNLSQEFLD